MEEDTTILSTALHALAHEERRTVLEQLVEDEESEVEVLDQQKKAALIHNHLPKLADNGYIEYSHTESAITVRRGPAWEMLADLYERVINAEMK